MNFFVKFVYLSVKHVSFSKIGKVFSNSQTFVKFIKINKFVKRMVNVQILVNVHGSRVIGNYKWSMVIGVRRSTRVRSSAMGRRPA